MDRHAPVLALTLLLSTALACGPELITDETAPIDFYDNLEEQGLINCTESHDTGYSSGNSFQIDVVTVDGKPAEVDTANAYWVMQQAAAAAGVQIRIVSGFRTMAQQQYLYGCYVNCNCNNCNLAATPGYSNHQSGHALDLNTSDAGVLNWLNNHGAAYGFARTVPSESWHWEWWGGGPGGGPCGGAPECLADPDYGSCNGTVITHCDENNQISSGDCGAFGAGCSTEGGAPHCVHPYCLLNLDGGESGTFCSDATKIGTCDLGVYSEGDCAAYGATCSEAGGQTHCVHYLCNAHLDGAEDGDFCLDENTMGRCTLGAFEEITCDADRTCGVVGGVSQCATDNELDPPSDDPDDTTPVDGDDGVTHARIAPTADFERTVTRVRTVERVHAVATARAEDGGCSSTGSTPPLAGLALLLVFVTRRARRSGVSR